jgi:ParB-like chromosome segregation protein Spo0J
MSEGSVQAIKRVPVADLAPYARNSRTHSDEQVAKIAASIKEFGFLNPVITDGKNGIIAGHGRVLAAQLLGLTDLPCIEASHLTAAQRRAYVIADNRIALDAGWDNEMLKIELSQLQGLNFDLALTGFSMDEAAGLILGKTSGETDPDEAPEPEAIAVSQPGDIWSLGAHRVMCGDSTNADDVASLMGGAKAALLHADPPYGMGKQADGVANDNLYREKLDAFQMAWWAAFRPSMTDNASAYIWGNAPDLWRLWYRGGLADSELLEVRNEIVWDKKGIAGMASPGLTQFPEASERCLFFQVGNQFRGNINTKDFPETWEPLRSYLDGEAKQAGINAGDIRRLCGCSMFAHWFTRSQFNLIPSKHYQTLQQTFAGRFLRPWADLKREWDQVKGGPTSQIQGARSYFDNAHEPMRDVWEFSRVIGNERHGHATPKPVAMMERVMRSSLPLGGICAEPFGGERLHDHGGGGVRSRLLRDGASARLCRRRGAALAAIHGAPGDPCWIRAPV